MLRREVESGRYGRRRVQRRRSKREKEQEVEEEGKEPPSVGLRALTEKGASDGGSVTYKL